MRTRWSALFTAAIMALAAGGAGSRQSSTAGPRIEISFTAAARDQPVTGMVYVAISRDNSRPPIEQTSPTGVPLFSGTSKRSPPDRTATITADGSRPSGAESARHSGRRVLDAAVRQRLHAVRARRRQDGLAAHGSMGRTELEAVARAICTAIRSKYHVRSRVSDADPSRRRQSHPADPGAADTELVKRIKIKSQILTQVVGPSDLSRRHRAAAEGLRRASRRQRYPVNYEQGHFSLGAPGGFGRGGDVRSALARDRHAALHLRHAAAPVAVLRRLVRRELREQRSVRRRHHAGADSGGRRTLPRHPRAVGAHADRRIHRRLDRRSPTRSSIRTSTAATFALCPDAVDFRYHQIVNIYKDANAYFIDKGWMKIDRPNQRRPDGNIRSMMKDENWYELVVGDRVAIGWPVGHLGSHLLAGRRRRLSQAPLGQVHRRHRSRRRRALAEIRPAPHPRDELAHARAEDRAQDQRLHRATWTRTT